MYHMGREGGLAWIKTGDGGVHSRMCVRCARSVCACKAA